MAKRLSGNSTPRRSTLLCRAVSGLALLLAVGATEPAFALDETQRAAYDTAFDRMLKDPGSPQKALDYAEAAIKYGDLEGAVGALERLLVINPDLPRIRLELGVLYYRLDSFALARSYLDRVLASANIPADVKAQAQRYIDEIESRTSKFRYSGSVSTGVRWQDNANAGGGVVAGVGSVGSISGAAKQSDWNLFGSLSANGIYDFQRPDKLTLESNFSLYGQKQFKDRLSNLDLWLGQLDVGPRWEMNEVLNGLSVRPYLLFNYLMLQQSEYFRSWGGGLNASLPLTKDWAVSANAEVQSRDYKDGGSKFVFAPNRSGTVSNLRGETRYSLSATQLVALTGTVERLESRDSGEGYWSLAITPSYVIRFPFPGKEFKRPVTGIVSGGYLWRQYNQPSLANIASLGSTVASTQLDRQWSLGGTLNFDVYDNVGISVQLQQSWQNSSVGFYSYDNTQLSTSLSYAF